MDERIRYLRGLEPGSQGQASYQAILEAAAGLFQQFPHDAIALRDILGLSGVSNQTLYNHFPAGRNDVALVLIDRLHRSCVQTLESLCHSQPATRPEEPAKACRLLAASLARATFQPLKTHRQLLANLRAYLKAQHLGCPDVDQAGLEAFLHQEIPRCLGRQVHPARLAQTAALAARLLHGFLDAAIAHPEFDLHELESQARKQFRALLACGLKPQGGASGDHLALQDPVAPPPITGAPVHPAKQQAILARILNRKKQR